MSKRRRYLSNAGGYDVSRPQARYGWNKTKSSNIETLSKDIRDLVRRHPQEFYYNPKEWQLNKQRLQNIDGRYRNNTLDSIADRRYQYYKWLSQQNTEDYIKATQGANYYNNAINQARYNYDIAQDAANDAIWRNKSGYRVPKLKRFRGTGGNRTW